MNKPFEENKDQSCKSFSSFANNKSVVSGWSCWCNVYLTNMLEGMLNPKKIIVSPTRGWIFISLSQVTINGMKMLMTFPMLEVSPIAVDLIVDWKISVWQNMTNTLKQIEQPRYKITIIIWVNKLSLTFGRANNNPKIAPSTIDEIIAFFEESFEWKSSKLS